MKLALHQEYMQRHKSKAKFVLYKPKTFVLLQRPPTAKRPVCWRILTSYWRNQEKHPGFFEVEISELVHNGYANRRYTKNLGAELIYWEKYEFEILKFANEIKKAEFRAFKESEQKLGMWEAFLFMTDSTIAQRMNQDSSLTFSISQSLSKNLSPEERETACQKCRAYLSIHERPIYDFWELPLMSLLKGTESDWLAYIINE